MTLLLIHDKDHDLVSRGPGQASDGVCVGRGGGLAIYLSHLVAGLRERGHRVVVVSLTRDPSGPAEVETDAYRVRSFRFRFDREIVSEFDAILDREKPDVVHVHSIPTLHPRLLERLERRAPVVWSFHDVWPVCFRGTKLHPDGRLCTSPLGYRCVTGACHRPGSIDGLVADAAHVLAHPRYLRMYRRTTVVVPSGYLRDVLVGNGFDGRRVRVVPLFSRFAGCAAPAPEPAPGLIPTVLFVGRLSSEKGSECLIEALARLKDEAWGAAVVGDGPLRDPLPLRAQRMGLGDRIRFAGEAGKPELEKHYRGCSLVVMPSLVPESFGMVGVEAMAFAKPVVAFDAGGVTEWLVDGVNGFVVRHGDVPELADRIRRLVVDPATRARFGADGHRMQQDNFTLDRHLDRIEPVYDDLIEAHAGVVG